ncbi:hybrid sensor histidine kinase/response regulator [Rhodosalinus sediminis]|nr:hybrid sensor histidine kinase/response regulator [Rhodosalinus sediminis]
MPFALARYAAALAPVAAMLTVGALIDRQQAMERGADAVRRAARLAASSVDLRLADLTSVTRFCATSPALTRSVDMAALTATCGRYAAQLGAWVVVVETGETHRQILNTRADAPATLPAYPRDAEYPELLRLEAETRARGEPQIADVFMGPVLDGAVVSAGQFVRLVDGRRAVVYVSMAARDLSAQLDELAGDEGLILAVLDTSRRIVALSAESQSYMFVEVPGWLDDALGTGAGAGADLERPGPPEIGGLWDVGHMPLRNDGWTALAVRASAGMAPSWGLVSIPSGLAVVGVLISGLLVWLAAARDRAATRMAAAEAARREAEESDRQKSRLLASVAHDIRAPLVSLIGALDQEAPSAAAPEKIAAARGSAEALLQLVDDILELSFLGAGEFTLTPTPSDVREVAEAVLVPARAAAEAKGLDLRLEAAPGLPEAVRVDRVRLQQVLANLISNAIKYSDHGRVTLRITQERARGDEVTLRFAVEDTGVGLAPEDIPKTLREFGRLDRDPGQGGDGTGLGLAIVQRILAAMGARLSVESTPGEGSTFAFRLTVPRLEAQHMPDALRPFEGVTILYAEDEPVIRDVTTRRLQDAGATVVVAKDGVEALARLAERTPDLLLLDLQMPELDGVEVLRRAQRMTQARAIVRFVLTSHIAGPQAADARAAGADLIFTKPVQVRAMAAAFDMLRDAAPRPAPAPEVQAAPPPAPADAPVLDTLTFRDVVGDAEAGAALLDELSRSLRADIAAIGAALDDGDLPAAAARAHRACGVCQVTGAVKLAGALGRAEREARAGEPTALRATLAGLPDLLDATLLHMRGTLRDADGRGEPTAS